MVRSLLVLCALAVALAADSNECAWTNPSGVDYDFSGFKNGGAGYSLTYQDSGEQYTMHMALCEALSTSPCQPDTSVCQEWAGGGKKTIGKDQPSFAMGGDDNTVKMTLSGGETAPDGTCRTNNAVIDLICDSGTTGDPVWTYKTVNIANGLCSYELTVKHDSACPGGGASGSAGGGGLSGGSILLLICFPLFFCYCGIGIAYQKKVKEAEGIELIPNSGFWTSLPGLIKEGMRFTFYSVTRRADYAPL